MEIISPVSDLRNYNTVLEQVSAGSPVYLTVNGRSRFTIRDIADDEEFEKAKAMLRPDVRAQYGHPLGGEEEGWVSEDDVGHTSTANANKGLNTPPIAVRDLERVWAEVFEASASEETATKFVTFKSYGILPRWRPIGCWSAEWSMERATTCVPFSVMHMRSDP